MERQGPLCQIIDGEPHSIYIDPDILRWALRFQPQEGDIILVTFPKSGTHWMTQIIQLILNRGESAKNFVELSKRAPFLEFQGEQALEGLALPRLIRTHLALGQIHFSDRAKYVYVARNPWDSCLSAYHFMKQAPGLDVYGTLDEYLELFLRGEAGSGDHLEHVLSGYTRRMEPNVFFLTYEELKQDTPGAIKRLAYFLSPEHGKAIEENQDLLGTIVEKSSVEYMKSLIQARQNVIAKIFIKNKQMMSVESNDRENGLVTYIREAKVGGWQGSFTRDQLRKMEARIMEVSQTSDVMNLWKEEWVRAKSALNE